MPDPRARRGFPERWSLPPAPREDPARRWWDAASYDERRRIARTRADDLDELTAEEREVVAELQRARLATRWRLLAMAPVLGWLLVMTFWGFGRSSFPESEGTWLLAGLVVGALGWFVAALATATRLRRTRSLLAAVTSSPDDETADEDADHTG